MAPKVDKVKESKEAKKVKAAEKKAKKSAQLTLKLHQGQAVVDDQDEELSEQTPAADGTNFAGRLNKRGRDDSNLHDQSTSSIGIVSIAASEQDVLSEHGSPPRKSPRKQKTPVKANTAGIV